MRFTTRAPRERTSGIHLPPDEVLQLGDTGLPEKAELLLGARTRSPGRTDREEKSSNRWRDAGVRNALPHEQKTLGSLFERRAKEAVEETQQSWAENVVMPDATGRLRVWPPADAARENSRSAVDGHQTAAAYGGYQPSGRPGIPPRRTSSNAVQAYYDPTQQPMHVSQQTSASAVRDKGLRKGPSMTIHETFSDPTLTRRPLKSAMKKQSSTLASTMGWSERPDTLQKVRTNSSDGKTKKGLNISKFFPHPNRSESRNLLYPNNAATRSPSALADTLDQWPQETVQVQLKRPEGKTHFITQKSAQSVSIDAPMIKRPKVFETDIFDQAKTNVRRPPKGIQNWFDGSDISSDEEEKPQPIKVNEPQPVPQELPANEFLPSTYSPWTMKPESEQPRLNRKASRDPVEDNLLAIEHAKERMHERMRMQEQRMQEQMQRKGSVGNTSVAETQTLNAPSFVSSVDLLPTGRDGRKRGGESRLAMSELASQSVLSLSDSDGEEKARGGWEGERDVSVVRERPRGEREYQRDITALREHPARDREYQRDITALARLGPPKAVPMSEPSRAQPASKERSQTPVSQYQDPPSRLPSKRSTQDSPPRKSTSTSHTNFTSGSIPIRLTDSIALPPMPSPMSIPPTPGLPTPSGAKRDTQSSYPDSTAHPYSDPTAQALRKLTGRDSRRTTKTSAAEYQETVQSGETSSSMPTDASHLMAVTEEEMILLELMRNKRAAMQKNSFTEGYQLALKREQEHLARRRESAQQTALKILRQKEGKENAQKGKSRRGSKQVDLPTPVEEKSEEWARRKFSSIRKEDVDKALKLEKYFGNAETPVMEDFPEPPSRSNTATEFEEQGQKMQQRLPPQKFELLLPNTYSPSPTNQTVSPTSADGSSPVPELEDIEDHHDQVRQFLASSSASASASEGALTTGGMFPTPPSAKLKSETRSKRRSMRSLMSPSPVAEEEPIPDLPVRSTRRPSPPMPMQDEREREREREMEGRRESISGRRLSVQIEPGSPFEPMPAPLRQASKERGHSPYHLTPNFDFTPLDFAGSQIGSQLTASPSLSTSRASPLTPTFNAMLAPEKAATEGAYSSDNASYRGRAYTPDTDLTSLSASVPAATPASSKKRGAAGTAKKIPPKLDTIASTGYGMKRNSMTSITSAGEDVLAAWAELGGGREGLSSRRRVR